MVEQHDKSSYMATLALSQSYFKRASAKSGATANAKGRALGYLANVLKLTGRYDWYVDQVLAKRSTPRRWRDRQPVVTLIAEFARRGRVDCLAALKDDWIAWAQRGRLNVAQEIVEVCGVGAYREILVTIASKGLKSTDWDWLSPFDDELVDEAAVLQVWKETVIEYPQLRTLLGFDERIEPPPRTGGTRKLLTVEDLFSKPPRPYRFKWRYAGLKASDEDANRVAEALKKESDKDWLGCFLTFFSKKEYPGDPRFLIDLVSHDDHVTGGFALHALSQIKSEIVRRYAIETLEDPAKNLYVLELLTRNYERGDDEVILEFLQRKHSAWGLHNHTMDVMDIARANPDENLERSLVAVRDLTPCEICRDSAIRLIAAKRELTPEELKEMAHDSDSGVREQASR